MKRKFVQTIIPNLKIWAVFYDEKSWWRDPIVALNVYRERDEGEPEEYGVLEPICGGPDGLEEVMVSGTGNFLGVSVEGEVIDWEKQRQYAIKMKKESEGK